MSEPHGNASDPHGHATPALAEPHTPLWFTALGAVLFLVAGLFWGLRSTDKADAAAAPAAAATGAADAGRVVPPPVPSTH